MNYLILIFGFIFLIYRLGPECSISKEGQLVYSILDEVASKIKYKHKLIPVGSGVSMFGGPVKQLSLTFFTKTILTKEQLRSLLIASANDFVELVNSNPNMINILANPPFTTKNVQIIIFNHDKKGNKLFHPEIGVAEILSNQLSYSTNDPLSNADYKQTDEETYEEAIKLIEL